MNMKFISKFTRKKSIAYLLILALIIPMIIPSFGGTAYVKAAEPIGDEVILTSTDTVTGGAIGIASALGDESGILEEGNLGNIFTNVKVTINDIDIEAASPIAYKADMDINLLYTWEFDNDVDLKNENYATTKIPVVFKPTTYPMNGSIMFNGTEVGTYKITEDNILTATFNGELQELEERQGELGFNLKLDPTEFKDDATQEIKFEDVVEKTFNITLKPGGDNYSVTKNGIPDQTVNAKTISWTIDANTTLDKLENGSIKDVLPPGLTLDRNSIKVYELQVGYNSVDPTKSHIVKKIPALGNGLGYTLEATDTSFKIKLGETSKAYRVEYTTTVEEYLSSYDNTAILKDGDDQKGEGKFNVNTITVGSSIEKSGTLTDSNTKVEWKIDVNQGELKLNNVVVEDTVISDELSIDYNTIKIYKLNYIGNKWVQDSTDVKNEFTVVDNGTKNFSVNLGNLNKQAYRIVYKTDIDFSTYKSKYELKNKAELFVDSKKSGEKIEPVDLLKGTLLEKSGGDSTSYGAPEITWKVTANTAKHAITNATIVDVIPAGLKLDMNSIVIKKDGNKINNNIVDITNIPDGNLIIKLGDTNNTYEIAYTTEVIDASKAPFVNNVSLIGDGLKGEGIGPDYTISKEASVTPSKDNKFKKLFENNKTYDGIEYKKIDYKEKTFSWKLMFDTEKIAIDNLIITDTFEPVGSMMFLKESLRVTTIKNGVVKTLVEDTDYTIEDKGINGFILKFNESGLQERVAYEIFYKSSFDPDVVTAAGGTIHTDTTKPYKNKANFKGETIDVNNKKDGFDVNIPAAEISPEVNIWNGGKKDGILTRNNREITWKIYVNTLEQDLTGEDFIISDVHSKGQVFREGSLTVKEFTLSSSGGYDVKSDVTSDSYNLDVNDKGFTLTFEGGIKKAYLIEYKTDIIGISEPNYTNTANVTGKNLVKKYDKKVNYANHDKFIDKIGLDIKDKKVYPDDEIDWEVILNTSLSDLEDVEFEDTISGGQVYVYDSLKVYVYDGSEFESTTVGYTLTDYRDTNTIKLNFPTMNKMYKITYKTVVTSEVGDKITNTATINGKNVATNTSGGEDFTVTQSSWGTGSGVNKGSLKVIKVEKGTITRLEGAGFELWYKLNNKDVQVKNDGKTIFYTDNQGVLLISGLSKGREYTIKEVMSPDGYKLHDDEIDNIQTFTAESGKEIVKTFENEKLVSVKVTKGWVESPKKVSVTVNLLANNVVVPDKSVVLSEDNNWTHTFEKLNPSENGVKIVYTVSEVKVENYDTEITVNGTNSFLITNTYTHPKTQITVSKVWNGGPDKRPEIPLTLYRESKDVNKEVVETITLSGDKLTYTWESMDLNDPDGNKYTYTVDELTVPENYEKSVYGLTITNTYKSPKTEVTGTKVWVNGSDVKPTIQLQLKRNGIDHEDPITLKHPDTSYTWNGLDKTDSNGVKYVYRIEEVKTPDNYGMHISDDGLTITNTYGSPTRDVTGFKEWVNGPEQRPDIKLQLYINNAPLGEPVNLENGDTSYTWKALNITDKDGKPYTYTVDEVSVPANYIKTSKGDSLTVTNSYVIPKTDVTGTKIWSGIHGVKPVIKIQLYRDDVSYGDPITLNDGDTSYTWLDLDKTDINGHEYQYAIDEVEVPTNYRKTISADGLTISNAYVDPAKPVDPMPDPDPTPTPGPRPTLTPSPTPTPRPTPRPRPTATPIISTTEEPTGPPTYELTEVPDPNDPDSPDVFILIDENGVPLGKYTKEKQPDGSYLYIDDNDVPLGTIIQKLPKTGEEELGGYYLIGIILALMGVVVTLKRKKENELNDN